MEKENRTANPVLLKDLINRPDLQNLSDSFTQLTGIPTAIGDLEGNPLVASGWQTVCKNFHRKNPITRLRCLESDTTLANQLLGDETYNIYKCKNGLVDIAIPIIIENMHLGNLYAGQIFIEPPDIDFFTKQAETFNYDKDSYLDAISKTPIIAPEKIKQALNFLINLTQIIVSTGVDKKKLLDYNKNLEQKIQDRTAALNTEIKIRKKAEVQLRSNQKFLESVFDAIQDGISVLDSDLNIVQANQIMYKLYPHLTESLGKKCYRVYHGRSERCDVCPSIRSIESRKPEMNEIPLTLNNKRVGTLELFSFPIMDESGGVKGLVEYVRDITKRKHIENQIRMEKEFSESLINCLPGIMYVFDRSGRIKRWNKNFETVTGYGENQIAEMTPMDFIAPRDKINVKKTIDRINQEGLFTIEAGLSTIDGRVIPYLFTGYKYVTQEIEYIIGVGLDITERKKTEAEKEGLIEKLQESLSEVRQLSGLLPICASCKKIRDDKGYWNQLESYIEHHTNAAFSHGMCPECSDKFYGHENWYKRMKRKKGQ